jgi:hypothetical protein
MINSYSISSILGGFSSRTAFTVNSALEYSKFIITAKRATFLRIQAEKDPTNNSAGLGKLAYVSGETPKFTSDSLICTAASLFEEILALTE